MVSVGVGRTQVFGRISKIGDDFLICIEGGKSHIGAVAMAEIHSKRHEISVLTARGHKETELAKMAAKMNAIITQQRTLAIVGIHQDNITQSEISQIIENTKKLIKILVDRL